MAQVERTFLQARFAEAGIEQGDALLLHSSTKRTLVEARRAGLDNVDFDSIIDALLDMMGPQGTLIFPLFNFDFTSGTPFNLRQTKSQMGGLTEAARLRAGQARSGHPIYSFCALGKDAAALGEIDNQSGYGPDSPFDFLRDLDGKIGVLDLPDQNSMTFYHYVEEMLEVDYRYHKHFTGAYTGWDGQTIDKTYSLFVRDLERGIHTYVNPAGEMMWDAGLYFGHRPGEGGGLRTVKANKMFECVAEIIRSGNAENNLYRIEAA